jgi:hypothetical protein
VNVASGQYPRNSTQESTNQIALRNTAFFHDRTLSSQRPL